MLADESIPSEPLMTLASSVRMSPNMFSVTITSKSVGRRMICIAALSTNMKSTVTSGYSQAVRWAVSRHMRDVSNTLALSTTVRCRRRVPASRKATRSTCSISSIV